MFQWKFNDVAMLLGSDSIILSTSTRQPVRMYMRDIEEQISSAACLDLWLDNLMSGAEELALCYHKVLPSVSCDRLPAAPPPAAAPGTREALHIPSSRSTAHRFPHLLLDTETGVGAGSGWRGRLYSGPASRIG